MSKQQVLLAAAAVAALASVAAILFYRKGICETAEEIYESFAYDEADLDIIKKLRRIQKAEEIVYNLLKDILKEVNSDKLSSQMKNLLLELSTDVDFIFSKIDALEIPASKANFRQIRKTLVEKTTIHAQRIDTLLKGLHQQ